MNAPKKAAKYSSSLHAPWDCWQDIFCQLSNLIFFFQQSFFCPKQQASDPLQLCCPLEGIQPQIEDKPTLPDKNECGTQTGAPASCTLYNKVSIVGVASLLG